jgi:phosphotriesterase-related protein
MGIIRTLLGDYNIKDINGFVLLHEHLKIDSSNIKKDIDAKCLDETAIINDVIDFKKLDGELIVDQTPYGLKKDKHFALKVMKKTGVKIVISTGFYFGLYLPEFVINWSVERIRDFFLNDIYNENYPCGLIGEIGISGFEILPAEERIIKGAIEAQKKSNVPISFHTYFGMNAKQIIKVCNKYGANLNKVILSHMDLYPDVNMQAELAKLGVIIGYDNISRKDYRSDEERALALAKLIDKGFENQIYISSDRSRLSHHTKYGGKGYKYVIEEFLKILKKYIDDQTIINKLLKINPLKILEIKN